MNYPCSPMKTSLYLSSLTVRPLEVVWGDSLRRYQGATERYPPLPSEKSGREWEEGGAGMSNPGTADVPSHVCPRAWQVY